jgi:anti-anti-sigma factor
MKRHLTASPPGIATLRSGDSVSAAVTPHPPATRRQGATAKVDEPGLVLRSVASWTHTLVLTGELTHRTAHAFEVEIERLCEEGVTGITVDLRELTRIDPVGVAVIAFRWGLCERRGYGFELIRGSTRVQRAFADAGVIELLPFREDDAPVLPVGSLLAEQRTLEGRES